MACDNDSDLLCCPKDEAMQLNIVHRHFIQSESALADWTLKEMDRNGWITLKYHGRNASRMHTQWVSKTIAITAMIQETKQKKRFEKPLCHFFSPFVTFLWHRVSGKSSDRFSFGGSLSQPQCLSRLQTVGGAIGSRSTVAEGSPMTHSFFLVKKVLRIRWKLDRIFFWKMCVCFFFWWICWFDPWKECLAGIWKLEIYSKDVYFWYIKRRKNGVRIKFLIRIRPYPLTQIIKKLRFRAMFPRGQWDPFGGGSKSWC